MVLPAAAFDPDAAATPAVQKLQAVCVEGRAAFLPADVFALAAAAPAVQATDGRGLESELPPSAESSVQAKDG